MTEYERGYADGYNDGIHKFMPEVQSVPIPERMLNIKRVFCPDCGCAHDATIYCWSGEEE